MTATAERVRVIASAAVTWLVFASVVLSAAVPELVELLGADHAVVVFVARALVWVGAAVAIIRRVSPVEPDARGILNRTDVPAGAAEIEHPTEQGEPWPGP